MASNIVSETIDANFPVAGVDNDSQGFRDNFDIIKDNFASAKAEISDLQQKVILKEALEGETLDNNMLGAEIIDVVHSQSTEKFVDIGTVSAAQNISFLNGHYQTFVVNGDFTFTLADWPDDSRGTARITVELVTDNSGNYTLAFVGEENALIKDDGSATWINQTPSQTGVQITSDSNPRIIEFWSYKRAGEPRVIYAKDLGVFGVGNV